MRSRAPSTRTNRTRQAPPAATRAVAVEGDYPVDARGPRLLASRSRPNQQPTLKPEGHQRCHMLHDRPEHQRRRWFTLFRRRALGDASGLNPHKGTGFATTGVRTLQEGGIVDVYWEYTGTSLTT